MIVARAPLRITLGGGGTDLPSYASRYGGFVLSAAIDKYVYICVHRPAIDDAIRLKYSRSESVTAPEQLSHDLVRPALQLLGLDRNIEIASMADVPAGTGLGSSGAYLVALLSGLHALRGDDLAVEALAEEAAHIEMDIARHPVGKHDHFVAAFGGMPSLQVRTDGSVCVERLNLTRAIGDAFRNTVLLFYTGVTRRSSDVLAEQQRDTDAGDGSVLDSLHRTKELGYRIKDALELGDIERFGLLLDEHWHNKKRRSARVSTPLFDDWYELAKAHGALGGKIMGAGAGGFFMICCPGPRQAGLRRALTMAGLREMPYEFDVDGARVLIR